MQPTLIHLIPHEAVTRTRRRAMALSALATFLCTIMLPLLLFLVTVKLWEVYMIRGRDAACPSPLPPGTMGLPFIGETLQLILQVKIIQCV